MATTGIEEKPRAATAVVASASRAADPLVTELAAQDTVPWHQKPNLRYLYLLMIPTCLGVEMTSGFDSSMMNGLQAVASWDNFFNKPRGSILGLMSAIYSLGAVFALPIVPWFTDRFGRRHAINFGSALMIIGAALQTASVNLAMFLIGRFIMGLGIPFAIVGASSLIGELSHPKERATLGALFNACYFIGSITAAAVTLGTFAMKSDWGWRIPSLLQVCPSIMQIVFMFWLPESPRWLISKGRNDEALAILVKYHAEGDETSEFVKAEYAQIETTLELERETSKVGWKTLFATAGMRRRALIGSFLGLATQWSGNGLTSYFLARILDNVGVTNNKTKNIVNLALTIWGMVNATFFALTVTKFKRRTAYLICTISILAIFTGWTVASERYAVTKSKHSSHAVIAFIFLYSPAYNIGFNALTYTFLVEVFPFQVRAKGVTLFQAFGRSAGFFNQFVNPIGIKNAGWKFYLSYVIWIAIEVLFVYFLFPETSGRTLEELTFLYEGDEIRNVQKERVRDEVVGGDEFTEKASEEREETRA